VAEADCGVSQLSVIDDKRLSVQTTCSFESVPCFEKDNSSSLRADFPGMCTPRQEATSPRAVASPKVSAQGTRQEAKVLTLPHASPSRLPCSPGGTARRSTSPRMPRGTGAFLGILKRRWRLSVV
jgi:hypothetical protein